MNENTLIACPIRLDERQFAAREGVSVYAVRDWAAKGYGPKSYRIGRRRVYDLEDVIRWETEQKAASK